MKTSTRLALVGAIAAAAVLALPGTAGAAGETVGGCFVEEYEHIVGESVGELTPEQEEELEAAADECIEAPNPILPETNEIIWGAISFLVVFALLAKFAFPAMKKAMAAREERIRADLEGAEQSRAQADAQLAEYQAQLADARAESGRIIEEARQAADQVRRDLMARAEAEASELRARAAADVQLATQRAMADVRRQVADLSIELAERIVERSLDRDTQRALIDSYIDQVGS